MDWAIQLWNKNKLMFFIWIPVILIFVFKDVIMALVVKKAVDTVNHAEKTDEKLRQEQQELKAKADAAKAKADEIKAHRETRTEEDVDNDWYKKEV